MSERRSFRAATGSFLVTVFSMLGCITCMLGLIFAIPSFVAGQGTKRELLVLIIWGAGTIACFVIFCLGLMHTVRGRRRIG